MKKIKIDIEADSAKLRMLGDVKHVITDSEKNYLRRLCDTMNERYDPCNCPDYHHDLAMQLLIKLKRQSKTPI